MFSLTEWKPLKLLSGGDDIPRPKFKSGELQPVLTYYFRYQLKTEQNKDAVQARDPRSFSNKKFTRSFKPNPKTRPFAISLHQLTNVWKIDKYRDMQQIEYKSPDIELL